MSDKKPADGKVAMGDRKPAARVGDLHSCPDLNPTPHIGGSVVGPGSEQVLIGGWHAAREGDEAICAPGHAAIKAGGLGVLIDGRSAARETDKTVHGGVIETGYPTVRIGAAPVRLSPDQTVALAMIQIRNSKFAKTPEGKLILARLEEIYAAGEIKCIPMEYKGMHLDGKITINSNNKHTVGTMAGLLVHEGTHAIAPDSRLGATPVDEEERCFRNEIAYNEQLAGGSGDKDYDEEMRDLVAKRGYGDLKHTICHAYKREEAPLHGCYFGAPQNEPKASQ